VEQTPNSRVNIRSGIDNHFLNVSKPSGFYVPPGLILKNSAWLIQEPIFPQELTIIFLTFQSLAVFYVPPGSILKNSAWYSLCIECFLGISEQTATFALYIIN
jgi:hypothetical protein